MRMSYLGINDAHVFIIEVSIFETVLGSDIQAGYSRDETIVF